MHTPMLARRTREHAGDIACVDPGPPATPHLYSSSEEDEEGVTARSPAPPTASARCTADVHSAHWRERVRSQSAGLRGHGRAARRGARKTGADAAQKRRAGALATDRTDSTVGPSLPAHDCGAGRPPGPRAMRRASCRHGGAAAVICRFNSWSFDFEFVAVRGKDKLSFPSNFCRSCHARLTPSVRASSRKMTPTAVLRTAALLAAIVAVGSGAPRGGSGGRVAAGCVRARAPCLLSQCLQA